MTDPLGRTTKYVYDNLGRTTERIDPAPDDYSATGGSIGTALSPVTYYGYDANGNLKWVTDPRAGAKLNTDYTTYYFYDTLNRPVCTIDALGQDRSEANIPDSAPTYAPGDHSVRTTYDKLGDVTSVQDQLGRVTDYTYDNLGRKTAETQHDSVTSTNPTTTFGYDPDGNLTSITDPLLHKTWTSYDALNRPIRSVSALGSGPSDMNYATVTAYDAVGNVSSVTDPAGNTTRYTYDRLNREVKETDPLWNSSLFQYDAAGNLTDKTDRNGRVTRYLYDSLGRQIEEDWLASDGVTVTHATKTFYDAAGQVFGVQDPGATYYYQYDQDGRVTRSRMAPGDMPQTTSLTWSPINGTLSSTTSTYTYTLSSDLLDLGTSFSATVTSTGSPQFHPYLELVSPSGRIVAVADSGSGYSATLQIPLSEASTASAHWRVVVTGSPRYAQSSGTYNYTLNMSGTVFTSLTDLSYNYDAAGNLTTLADSSAVVSGLSDATSYEYDALNRLKKAKQAVSSTTNERADYGYYDDGSIHTVYRYSNDNPTPTEVAHSTYGYDGMGRLTSLNHSLVTSSEPQPHYSYTFDTASRITSTNLTLGSPTYNWLNDASTITLDKTDQLTDATHSNQYIPNEDYDYDANGNRMNTGYLTGTANRLLSDNVFNYTYDKEGNRTERFVGTDSNVDGIIQDNEKSHNTTYTWDYRNRLTSVTDQDSSQWASSVIAYSSQYSSSYGSAAQALGEPDVPAYGDDARAWSPLPENGTTEYLTVGFTTPVYADGVLIRETCGNGFVIQVDVRNHATGAYETVWSGTDANQPGSMVDLNVSFAERSYLVDAVRVWVNTNHSMTTWEEIDAVQLRGTTPPSAAKVVEYTYDAFDRRIRKKLDTDGTGSTAPVYDYLAYQGDRPLLEFFDADDLSHPSATTLTHRYLNAVDQVLADYQPDIGPIWLLPDHEGTVRDLLFYNGTDYVVTHRFYDSFGNISTYFRYYVGGRLVDTNIGFQGSLWDADVYLSFMGSTPYDPQTGRFAREDQAFPPVETNLYRADRNNPLIYVDPTGRQAEYSGSAYTNINTTFSQNYPQYNYSSTSSYNSPFSFLATTVGSAQISPIFTTAAGLYSGSTSVASSVADSGRALSPAEFGLSLPSLEGAGFPSGGSLFGLSAAGSYQPSSVMVAPLLPPGPMVDPFSAPSAVAPAQSVAQSGANEGGIGFWDWVQGGLDAGGVVEPTPFCDLTSGVISLFRGKWADAGFSALAMVPYIGDAGKIAKYGNKLRKAEKVTVEAVELAADVGKVESKVVTTLTKGGTYKLVDPVTEQVMRTGRTRNLVHREAQHASDPLTKDLEFQVDKYTESYFQQRGREQIIHDLYKPPMNKINPIYPKNPLRQIFLNSAEGM